MFTFSSIFGIFLVFAFPEQSNLPITGNDLIKSIYHAKNKLTLCAVLANINIIIIQL